MASNALGTVNPIAPIRARASDVGALLLVDAVHHAAHFAIDVAALDVDFLLCSAYKFYGPHVGVLYSRPGLLDRLSTDRLVTQHGEAPWRIETGTLNHAALAGVEAASTIVASWGDGADRRARLVDAMTRIAAYEHGLARRYFERLQEVPGARVWGPPVDDERRAPTVSITLDAHPAGEVARRLAAEEIAVWSGDFYARRVVERLGLAERGGLLRTGFAMYNLAEEVDRLVEALQRIARV